MMTEKQLYKNTGHILQKEYLMNILQSDLFAHTKNCSNIAIILQSYTNVNN